MDTDHEQQRNEAQALQCVAPTSTPRDATRAQRDERLALLRSRVQCGPAAGAPVQAAGSAEAGAPVQAAGSAEAEAPAQLEAGTYEVAIPAIANPERSPREFMADTANFSGLSEVQGFARDLAAYRVRALSERPRSLQNARTEAIASERAAAQAAARRAAAGGRRAAPAPAASATPPAPASDLPTDAAPLQEALNARTLTELQQRWHTSLTVRFGGGHRTIGSFARNWMSDERERVVIDATRDARGTATLRGYTHYVAPTDDMRQGIEAGSRAAHPNAEWQDAGAAVGYARYRDLLTPTEIAAREARINARRPRGAPPHAPAQGPQYGSWNGYGEAEQLEGGRGRVAPFTNQFVRALRGHSRDFGATSYTGHGAPGAWQGAGLCVDFTAGSSDARGFFNPQRAMTLLQAIDATARELGADWQGCYDDHVVLAEARRVFGGNKLVYVNDARRNNHGPLLLHIHVDILPPGVPRPPQRVAAASEVGR